MRGSDRTLRYSLKDGLTVASLAYLVSRLPDRILWMGVPSNFGNTLGSLTDERCKSLFSSRHFSIDPYQAPPLGPSNNLFIIAGGLR